MTDDEPLDSRGKLLARLKALEHGDKESNHVDADEALLEFIDDPEITEAFNAIDKWYA